MKREWLHVHQMVTYGHAVMDTQWDCSKQRDGQQRQEAQGEGEIYLHSRQKRYQNILTLRIEKMQHSCINLIYSLVTAVYDQLLIRGRD